MKRYDNSRNFDTKNKTQQWKQEHKSGGFKCSHCKQFVVINDIMGTANRNHCNICLWSKHVDIATGDRKSDCQAGMKPIGLTFKHEGYDRVGEIMLVHVCAVCNKLSINRTARDDYEHVIQDVYERSLSFSELEIRDYGSKGVDLLTAQDTNGLMSQLFGSVTK